MNEIIQTLDMDTLSLDELSDITKACLAAMYRKLRQEEWFSHNIHCFSTNLSGDLNWVEMVFVDDNDHIKYI